MFNKVGEGMVKGTSSKEVKKINRNRVFRYLNTVAEASMPEIAAALRMSGPTVLTIVGELCAAGVVEEVGELASTGGRKAKAYAVVKDAFLFLGIDITRNHIGIVSTDLSEDVVAYRRQRRRFANTEAYRQVLGDELRSFIADYQIDESKIRGIGVAIPGIVDANRNVIKKSHTLQITEELTADDLCKYIDFPCVLANDANAGAIAECAGSNRNESLIYLSLSNTVGGAILLETGANNQGGLGYYRNMYVGDNWEGGEFGHVVIRPEGRTCYCGKKGCLDPYCSALVLASMEDGKLEEFFPKLEAGSKRHQQVWQEYLDNLAYAVDMLVMSMDCDIVLGGYVGSFMEPYLEDFKAYMEQRIIFKKKKDFLRTCKYKVEAAALGAAVFLVEGAILKI